MDAEGNDVTDGASQTFVDDETFKLELEATRQENDFPLLSKKNFLEEASLNFFWQM